MCVNKKLKTIDHQLLTNTKGRECERLVLPLMEGDLRLS